MSQVLSREVLAAPGVALGFDDLMHLQHLARAMRERRPRRLTALPGGFVGKRRGRGLDIHDIRPWQYGDEIRHTDHNATARTGVPFTRTFRDERESTLLLVADFRPSMLFGTRAVFRSVAAATALALEGWRAVAEGAKVGATVLTGSDSRSMAPGRGPRAMTDAISLLVRAHADALANTSDSEAPLDVMLETAARPVPHGAAILVATALDAPGEGFAALVTWLARRNDLCFILVRDAFERAAPPGVYPFVTSGGRRGSLRANTQAHLHDARADMLRRLGAPAVRLDTDAGSESFATALETLHG